MTLDDVKQALADAKAGTLKPTAKVIGNGFLNSANGLQCEYEVHMGWDMLHVYECDKKWRQFNIDLIEYVCNNTAAGDLDNVVNGLQLEDAHWHWIKKAAAFNSEEYTWFFLFVENEVQAACLTYHPKPSAINAAKIFYVDFIAVAPWNRQNPMCKRKNVGVGSILIKEVNKYMKTVAMLTPGFCLHSLPKAESFYKKIGMKPYPHMDKDGLAYFEMPPPASF